MRLHLRRHLAGTMIVILSSSLAFAQNEPTDDQVAFFENRIRPVLVESCYDCHSADADDIGGGLVVDSREGLLTGGDSGPAIVPGNPRRSLLLEALQHANDDLKMPPDEKLADDVIADFSRWIRMGAPDPREGVGIPAQHEIDIEAGRTYWAFQAPTRISVPQVQDQAWPISDIDRFLLAKLEAEALTPVDDADPHTLIRRIHFDLIGLPPDPYEIQSFVEQYEIDPRKAIASSVDRLLDSPQFGERWARHWLDVARFAESSGGSSNLAYPHAWRYRDYVIDAFNTDKPYHEFIREQIAGDLLSAKDDRDKAENLTATGFLAIGSKSHNERNRGQFRADLADEQIDATFQAFQALTVACARCHDHKFDPIPQSDYYALAGIFASTETCYGTIRIIQSNHPSELLTLPDVEGVEAPQESLTRLRRGTIERQIERLEERLSEIGRNRDQLLQRIVATTQLAQLKSQLELFDEDGTPKLLAMGVRDRRFIQDSPLLIRGEIDQPGERVPRGIPQVLTETQPNFPRRSSGRLELANWLASSDNPLTARVMVNRIWLHLMGRGLVPTPDNFGASGLAPSHPELLDYLAVTFVEKNWSIKELIRTIMSSRAYQLASTYHEQNFAVDPDNQWYWRMPKRRLEAEAIRDTMLWLSGNLESQTEVVSPVALAGEGNVTRLMREMGSALNQADYRSVYLPIIRDQLPEALTLYDFPDPSLIVGERASTTIPSQALYMLNNPFVIQQSQGLASRLLTSPGNDSEKIRLAYQLCYSRLPNSRELSNAQSFVRQYGRQHSTQATWSAFSQALFASAEFTQR